MFGNRLKHKILYAVGEEIRASSFSGLDTEVKLTDIEKRFSEKEKVQAGTMLPNLAMDGYLHTKRFEGNNETIRVKITAKGVSALTASYFLL